MRIFEKFKKQESKIPGPLNETKFVILMGNPDFDEYFHNASNFLEIVNNLLDEVDDPEFLRQLETIKLNLEFINNQFILNTAFFKEPEKLNLSLYFESSDPVFVIQAALCAIISGTENEKLKDHKFFISKIEEIGKLFDKIKTTGASYKIRCDLIDLVYEFSENYFNSFNIDIIKENTWIKEQTQIVNAYYDFLKTKPINIPPEKLGLIDITKLKG